MVMAERNSCRAVLLMAIHTLAFTGGCNEKAENKAGDTDIAGDFCGHIFTAMSKKADVPNLFYYHFGIVWLDIIFPEPLLWDTERLSNQSIYPAKNSKILWDFVLDILPGKLI